MDSEALEKKKGSHRPRPCYVFPCLDRYLVLHCHALMLDDKVRERKKTKLPLIVMDDQSSFLPGET